MSIPATRSVFLVMLCSLCSPALAAAQLMSTCVESSPETDRSRLLAVIVHDAAQPATMRMEEGATLDGGRWRSSRWQHSPLGPARAWQPFGV
jgi:hypothetical protein